MRDSGGLNTTTDSLHSLTRFSLKAQVQPFEQARFQVLPATWLGKYNKYRRSLFPRFPTVPLMDAGCLLHTNRKPAFDNPVQLAPGEPVCRKKGYPML